MEKGLHCFDEMVDFLEIPPLMFYGRVYYN